MNVLYCGDSAICQGVLLSALSLAKNTTSSLRVFILTSGGVNEKSDKVPVDFFFSEYLENVLKKYNEDNSVCLIDITDKFRGDLPLANLYTRFTPFCMLRLYADLAKEIPDRVLYLDNDTVCINSAEAFYNFELDGCDIAGVLDYYGGWFFRKNPFKRDYLNSGVLLLDMKKIRENGLFSRCRELCKTKKMFMPDQTALNKLSVKKICSRKYNEQKKTHPDTVFRHFTTTFKFFPYFHSVSVKPWNVDGVHNVLKTHKFDELLSEWEVFINEYRESEQNYETK